MNKLFAILFLLTIWMSLLDANAQSATLKVGDTAPDLRIQKWIKGGPIERFEEGKYYLIELSAVGCGPCRLAIPHLSEIARQYKGRVEVVSVYTMESNKKDAKDLGYVDRIENFTNKMGDKIEYTVAADVPQQLTFEKWGKAAGLIGIPSSFLVGEKGKILWIGYTQGQNIDEILAAVFSKTVSLEEIGKQVNRNSAHLQKILDEIFSLKKSNHITTAVSKMDSLLSTSTAPGKFHKIKFELLAGVDDEKAIESLRWLLDHETVDSFDWFHLIYESYSLPRTPNFQIAHQIADRAIEQAPTNTLAAFAMLEKARVYYAQKMIQSSVDVSSLALLFSRKDDNAGSSDVAVFEENSKWFKDQLRR
jgi:thiol-disulfide isomerase/thioredoxin